MQRYWGFGFILFNNSIPYKKQFIVHRHTEQHANKFRNVL